MRRTRRWAWIAVLAIFTGAWCLAPGPATACNTPVYRYAMYNWPASPYYVFYFHRGEVPKGDAATQELIEKMVDDEKAPVNLLLEKVDVSDEEALKRLPGVVTKAYEAHESGGRPFYVVFTPYGVELYAGPLNETAVRSLFDSPARQQIGKLLHEGNLTVLLLVPGKNEKRNKKAEKEARSLVAQLAAGKIDLGPDPSEMLDPYAAGPLPGASNGSEAKQEEPKSKLKRTIALVKVSRDDPAEKSLISALMEIEPDLKELAGEPMVFGVYGRGRALPPFVGEGILADNLVDLLFFLAGACSCQVKDQNPGMDLPMGRDWDAAAEAIAATDPAYADPYGYDEPMVEEPNDAEGTANSSQASPADGSGEQGP